MRTPQPRAGDSFAIKQSTWRTAPVTHPARRAPPGHSSRVVVRCPMASHLNNLVQTAYRRNLPLRVAGLRVLEARARRAVAVGGIFPQQQQGVGDYQRSQRSQDFGPSMNANSWRFGFNLAWELDVWGRFRRAIEAADADLDASVEGYDDVLLTLIGDVALTYVEIRTLQRRIEIACDNVDRQCGALKTTRKKAAEESEDGEISPEEEKAAGLQQESNVEQTKASIPPLLLALRQAQNRLSILLGIPPQRLRRPDSDHPGHGVRRRKSRPKGQHNDHHYVTTPSASLTWPEAEAYAQSLGGHLVTINLDGSGRIDILDGLIDILACWRTRLVGV